MRKSVVVLFVILLAFPTLGAGQTAQQKPASRKSSIPTAKPAAPSPQPGEQPSKRAYAELSIGELISEDANRWTDRMAAHAAVAIRILANVPGATISLDGQRVANPFSKNYPKSEWNHLVEVNLPGRPPVSTWMVFDRDRAVKFDPSTNTLR